MLCCVQQCNAPPSSSDAETQIQHAKPKYQQSLNAHRKHKFKSLENTKFKSFQKYFSNGDFTECRNYQKNMNSKMICLLTT